MTPEKIKKIMGLVGLYGAKNYWAGIYSERNTEKLSLDYARKADDLEVQIQKELDEELTSAPQSGVCSDCGQRNVLCVCNQE